MGMVITLFGSTWHKALPWGIINVILCIFVWQCVPEEYFKDADCAYAGRMIFTAVFFVLVFRSKCSYTRYRVGMDDVRGMFTEWANAYTIIQSFINTYIITLSERDDLSDNEKKKLFLDMEHFSTRLLHWFSLLGVFAVLNLTIHQRTNFDDLPIDVMGRGQIKHRVPVVSGMSISDLIDRLLLLQRMTRIDLAKRSLLKVRTILSLRHMAKSLEDARSKNKLHRYSISQRRSIEVKGFPEIFEYKVKADCLCRSDISSVLRTLNAKPHAPSHTSKYTQRPNLLYIDEITPWEAACIGNCRDRVLMVSRWITEDVTLLANLNTLAVAPAIFSRFHMQMIAAYANSAQATKISVVPFPFCFAQIVTVLLFCFVLVLPFIVLTLQRSIIFCISLSFLSTIGLWSLNYVAVELEDPFGDDPNDLPMVEMHNDYLCSLEESRLPPILPMTGQLKKIYEHSDLLFTKPSLDKKIRDSFIISHENKKRKGFGGLLQHLKIDKLRHRTLPADFVPDVTKRISSSIRRNSKIKKKR